MNRAPFISVVVEDWKCETYTTVVLPQPSVDDMWRAIAERVRPPSLGTVDRFLDGMTGCEAVTYYDSAIVKAAERLEPALQAWSPKPKPKRRIEYERYFPDTR